MRSFTFSSNRSLIFPIKVGVAALVLIAGYSALIALLKPNSALNYDAGLRNRVIAAQYAYAEAPFAALVGSSVTFRLSVDFMDGDYLGPKIFNLGLARGNPSTGMDIILRKPDKPRLIFVEMNKLEFSYDPAFVEQLYAAHTQTVWRYLPGLRLENRPLDLVIVEGWKAIRKLLGGQNAKSIDKTYSPEPSVSPTSDKAGSPVVDADYCRQIATNIEQLGAQVDQARNIGVRVILMYYPTHESISSTTVERLKKHATLERFPPAQYEWLDLQGSGEYQTEDGRHLTKSSAQRMATLLRHTTEAARDQ